MKEREFPHQFVEKMLEPYKRKIEGIQRFSRGQQMKLKMLPAEIPSVPPQFLKEEKVSQTGPAGYPETVYLELPERQDFSLTPAIESLLSKWLTIKLPLHYLHQSAGADQILKKRNADAMTVGNRIYFRSGQYQPQSSKGLGLIAHEMMHVIQNEGEEKPNQELERSMPGYSASGVVNRAEQQALEIEKFVYRQANVDGNTRQPLLNNRNNSARVNNAASPSQNAPAVMFAETERDVNPPPAAMAEAPASVTLSEGELRRIKQEVYRDLMMRIKIDFERGA